MNPSTLLRDLAASGLGLALEGSDLVVEGDPTDEQVALMRAHKAALVDLLTIPKHLACTDPEPSASPAGLRSPTLESQADPVGEAHSLWDITELDGTARRSCYAPPQTREEVLDRYPGALSVEPYRPAHNPPPRRP